MLAAIAEQSEEVSAIVDDLLVAARTDIGELTVADCFSEGSSPRPNGGSACCRILG